MKTSIPWRRLDQKGKSGTKKIQKKVLTALLQPLQPKKKTDIIKATSVFFAALLQSRAGPRERPSPRKGTGTGWGDDPKPVTFYYLRRLFQHARDQNYPRADVEREA